MYYPLSTGGNVRLAGLQEQQQLYFEQSIPWYPADFPGTDASEAWEQLERSKREEHWKKRPKGKRISWESLDLGNGRKGEIGCPWACDWEYLREQHAQPTRPATFKYAPPSIESADRSKQVLEGHNGMLATVKLSLITKGAPTTCARVYRLPTTNDNLRQKWWGLLPDPAAKVRILVQATG